MANQLKLSSCSTAGSCLDPNDHSSLLLQRREDNDIAAVFEVWQQQPEFSSEKADDKTAHTRTRELRIFICKRSRQCFAGPYHEPRIIADSCAASWRHPCAQHAEHGLVALHYKQLRT
jgi:hypothetical protein